MSSKMVKMNEAGALTCAEPVIANTFSWAETVGVDTPSSGGQVASVMVAKILGFARG